MLLNRLSAVKQKIHLGSDVDGADFDWSTLSLIRRFGGYVFFMMRRDCAPSRRILCGILRIQ
jgi:hypothetical protein